MSQIQHYFIILSEHNIAEYRACLHLRPQNVHLIVTDWVAGKNAHIRFKTRWSKASNFTAKSMNSVCKAAASSSANEPKKSKIG